MQREEEPQVGPAILNQVLIHHGRPQGLRMLKECLYCPEPWETSQYLKRRLALRKDSHQPHLATEHVKCGWCDKEPNLLKFQLILI